MTTTEGRPHQTTIQEQLRWYPISLQLRYIATSKLGSVLRGFGQTIGMSSKEIVLAPGEGLQPGMIAEIFVAWPRLLDNRIPLQLVLQVTITGSQYGMAVARLRAYDFRTAGPPATRQKAGAAS
jgi:hypothetical protein